MAEAALPAVEAAIENQRICALQIRVVAICTLIQMCDGYDVGSIGWAVPPLTHAWKLPPPVFALAFLCRASASSSARRWQGRSATGSGAGRCYSPAWRLSGSARC